MNFRTITDKKVNPISYSEKIIKENPFVEIHIGTDSQRYGNKIIYVTAIAYRYPARGVHYIYTKSTYNNIKDNWNRLWLETEMSMELAERISNAFPTIKLEIDMDYNNDEHFMSHKLVSAAKGWAKSCGYKVNIKPYKQIATRAADYHCR